MKVCYCQRGETGFPGDYMPVKETSINMGILGKGCATLAIVGMDAKLCLDISLGERNIEKSVSIKYCPFCGRKLEKDGANK